MEKNKVKENVKTIENGGGKCQKSSLIPSSGSTKFIFHPPAAKTEVVGNRINEDNPVETEAEVGKPVDKMDQLLALMMSQSNKLDDHIKKHDQDILSINNQIECIKENSRRIDENRADIMDLVANVTDLNERVEKVESEVKEKVTEIEKTNEDVIKELETRPTTNEVQKLVKEQVKKETGHLIGIMKSLLDESKKTCPQPSLKDFPNLELDETRPKYAEIANYTDNRFPAMSKKQSENINARKTVKDTFENTRSQEELILFHKQIVGIKPITRENLNFHATDLGMSNPEAVSDSKFFYCPTYFDFRMSFAYDYLYEVFGINKNDVRITDVKMCTKLSSQIMWITIGEILHLLGLASRMKRQDL